MQMSSDRAGDFHTRVLQPQIEAGSHKHVTACRHGGIYNKRGDLVELTTSCTYVHR